MQDASDILRDSIKVVESFDPKLYEHAEAPLVSIYLPVAHTNRENRLDDITRDTFKDLTKTIQHALSSEFSDKRFYSNIIDRLEYLLAHPDMPLWLNARKGLAFLVSNKAAYVFNLDFEVEPIAIVGDEYYIKPLLRSLENQIHYYLLALSTDRFAWIEGDEENIHRIPLPDGIKAYYAELFPDDGDNESALDNSSLTDHMSPYHDHKSRNEVTQEEAEQFFHYVNDKVAGVLAVGISVPVILVTLPEHEAMFRKISTIPTLLPKSISKNPDGIKRETLIEDAKAVLKDQRDSSIKALLDRYSLDASKGKASNDISEIGKALLERKVDTLMVLRGKSLPGKYDMSTGDVLLSPDSDSGDDKLFDPTAPDVVSSMVEAALRQDAKVHVMSAEEMPPDSFIAAIYRY